jgi:predicted component of type VI protein secretion system
VALELHIAGPGLDFTRRLNPGDPALILGRDPDCTICLADPERNVSRRHLSVWNEAEQLHFHVLSVVNGVDLPAGEVPPGGRGVLHVGEALLLSAYRVTVSMVSGDAPLADPWEMLEREAANSTSAVRGMMEAMDTVPAPTDDDPFGDWGFGSTFGPGSPSGALQADSLGAATNLKSFFQGLGLDPARAPALSDGEMETIGRLTRIALAGLMQAAQGASATKQELHAEDRTMIGAKDSNPLRMDMPPEAKLFYLFGGRIAAAGFVQPDRAVGDIVADVLAHQQAVALASREAVRGTLDEFNPEALKTRLLGTGGRLFESSRAWDAFVKDYGEQSQVMEQWVQRVLDRHFVDAYIREFLRVKRDTGPRRR